MKQLWACPFCRALYREGEHDVCPDCQDVRLVPMGDLPKSYEDAEAEAAAWEATPPEDRRLPLTYWRRGRGALLVVAVVGVLTFFAPWISMTLPELEELSGFDLARRHLPWLWGGLVGWTTLIPLVLSRRSVYQLRSVRIIAATFSVLTFAEVVLLGVLPAGGGRVPVSLQWAWGIYASAATSLVGTVIASRLGGSLEQFEATFSLRDGGKPAETSDGQTVN